MWWGCRRGHRNTATKLGWAYGGGEGKAVGECVMRWLERMESLCWFYRKAAVRLLWCDCSEAVVRLWRGCNKAVIRRWCSAGGCWLPGPSEDYEVGQHRKFESRFNARNSVPVPTALFWDFVLILFVQLKWQGYDTVIWFVGMVGFDRPRLG